MNFDQRTQPQPEIPAPHSSRRRREDHLKNTPREFFRRIIAGITALAAGLLLAAPSALAAKLLCLIDGCTQEVETETVQATCTTPGGLVKICPVHGRNAAGLVYAQHRYRKVADSETEATCLEGGTYKQACFECGDEQIVSDHDRPALGHDLVLVEEKAPQDGKDGIREHYACTRCGGCFSDSEGTEPVEEEDLIIPAHRHDLTFYPAVSPTEECEGNIAYWSCAECGACFKDGEAEEEISESAAVLPRLSHVLTYSERQEATEEEEGILAYWACENCGRFFRDEDAQEELAAEELRIPRKNHTLVFVPGREATEEEGGLQAHYRCTGCGKRFLDDGATDKVTEADLQIEKLGHLLEQVDAVAPTETTGGNISYYRCSRCGRMFADPDGKTELRDAEIRIPAQGHTHRLTEVAYKEAAETEAGNIRHYVCEGCGRLFADPDGKTELWDAEIRIPAKGHMHQLKETAYKAPTETAPGNLLYYRCDSCGKLYADADGTLEITEADTFIPATGHIHTLTEVPAVEPAETTPGNIHHYICSGCGKLFSDEDGKTELTENEVRVPATGHLHVLQEVPYTTATEATPGNIRHYICSGCKRLFSDPEGIKALMPADILIPASGHTHTLKEIPAKEATETLPGNIRHFVCEGCGKYFAETDGKTELTQADILVPVKDHVHTLKEVPAKEATETASGNIRHYVCEGCRKLFSDPGGKTELKESEVRVAAKGHTHVLQEVPYTAATETEPGTVRHYACSGCNKLFSDPDGKTELTQADTVIPASGHSHTLTEVPAKEATETADGNIRHYSCESCHKLFADPGGENELHKSEVHIPAKGHIHDLQEVPYMAATETHPGNVRHYVCSKCHKLFADTEGETERTPEDILIPVKEHVHQLREVPAAAATETQPGNIRHYICEGCGALFSDPDGDMELNKTDILIPAKGHTHTLQEVPASGATETAPGNIRYFICTDCGKRFADADGRTELKEADIRIPAAGHIHKLQEVSYREATETAAGNIRYFVCAGCGKMFSDPDGETELTDAEVNIPVKGHVHTLREMPAKAATETVPGNIRHYMCAGCGRLFTDKDGTAELTAADIKIPAAGHTLIYVEEKPATSTAAGWMPHWICSGCQALFADADAAMPVTAEDLLLPADESSGTHIHTYTETVTAPTCTEPGILTYTCTDCSDSYTAEGSAAAGHTYETYEKEGSCTEDALRISVCAICKDEIREVITPAPGHTLAFVEAKAPTAESAGNIAHWRCSVCGRFFADADGNTGLTTADACIASTANTEAPDDAGPAPSPTSGAAGLAPKTGDEKSLTIYLLLLGAAGVAAVLAIQKMRAMRAVK